MINCLSESNSTKHLLTVYLFKTENIINNVYLNIVLKLEPKKNSYFNSLIQKTTGVHFEKRKQVKKS